jgi:hypothetical protein
MNRSIIHKLLPFIIAMMLLVLFLTNGQSAVAESIIPGLGLQNTFGQSAPAPLAPGATSSHFRIAGTVFLPMDSRTTVEFDAFGCVHATAGAGNLLNAVLDIPDGATLLGMRMYYDDTSPNNITGAVTRFNSAGTDQEIVKTVSSTYASGHGNNYVTLDNHIVDTFNWSYVLTVYFDNVASNTLQVCGFIITYSTP